MITVEINKLSFLLLFDCKITTFMPNWQQKYDILPNFLFTFLIFYISLHRDITLLGNLQASIYSISLLCLRRQLREKI